MSEGKLSYPNLKEDAQAIWKIAKARLSDGVSMLDVTLIVTTLLQGVQAAATYLNETGPVAKKAAALALIDEIYTVEIRPLDLTPWDATEEALDEALGPIIHWAADKALDALLSEED